VVEARALMAAELYLLDTHVALWAIAAPRRLGEKTRQIISGNRYVISIASLWELIDKASQTGAPVRDPSAWWEDYVMKPRTPVLSITAAHLLTFSRLPHLSREPFGRILLAQAAVENTPLITADPALLDHMANTRSATE
jgi:PIN domain nuclease of toxin-antitoxin system